MVDELGMSKQQQQQQLLIKLKIPKLELEQDEEELEEGEIKEDHHDHVGSEDLDLPNCSSKSSISSKKDKDQAKEEKINNPSGIRVCPECFKEFSSGKALGGHMRIHAPHQPFHKKISSNSNSNSNPPNKNKNKKKAAGIHHQSYYPSCHDVNGQPICNLCGKNFPSLKSLFGHMRCHPEREWRGILPPPPRPPTHHRDRDYSAGAGAGAHHKSTCGSSSSDDHSDSVRNKIDQEDDDCDDPNSVEVDDEPIIDLPRWAVRAKRGRKAISMDTPEISTNSDWEKEEEADDHEDEEEEEEEEEEIRDAVEDLLMLAHGDHHQSFRDQSGSTHIQQRVDEFEATNSNSLSDHHHHKAAAAGILDGNSESKKRKFDAIRMVKGKGKSEYDDRGKNSSHDDESDSNEQLLINYKNMMASNGGTNGNVVMKKNPNNNVSVACTTTPNKKKRKKMKLMMDLESDHEHGSPPTTLTSPPDQVITPDKYICLTCYKRFPTHQALGGHRSSHNKFKMTIFNAINHHPEDVIEDNKNPIVANSQQVGMTEEIASDHQPVVVGGGTHQCKICSKIFPTGQALGGHKRCHWTGPVDQGPSSELQVNSPEGSRKLVEFDLNEPPPMEDEAHDHGSTSSSNNS